MREEIRRMATVTSGVAELTRNRAEELVGLIRGEIKRQIEALGLATTRDVQRLERRVARLEGRTSRANDPTPSSKTTARGRAPARGSGATQTSSSRKTTARKTTTRKTAARKTTARETAGRKTAARKATTKATPRKTGGEGTPS